MIRLENVKPGMILISDSPYYYTVIFVKKKLTKEEYFGFMTTNAPGGGGTLHCYNVKISKEFHEKNLFEEIDQGDWRRFKNWIFQWIFDTSNGVFIK